MAFQHAAFRQDLPATPANLPLNYVYPPPGQSSYTYDTYVQPTAEEIRKKEEVRKMWEEQREWERDREKKEDLYNSVIDSYIIIEHVKQHYQDNKKSQGELIRIQAIITILQILGVAVIYFNYSYSVLIFLGVICLAMYELILIYNLPSGYHHYTNSFTNSFTGLLECIELEKFEEKNYKLYRYYKTEAINHYGTIRDYLEDRIESDFNKYLNDMVHRRVGYERVVPNVFVPESVVQLTKSYNTAKQFCDCLNEKYQFNIGLFVCYFIYLAPVVLVAGTFIVADAIEKENYFPNERKNHTDTEIAFKYTMFITGSLFIVLKLIVRHIIIHSCYNPKIDMSPLFVKQPSERQPLLTNTIV